MRLLRIIPLALLIALVASPAQAWMSPAICGGGVEAAAECSTSIYNNTTGTSTLKIGSDIVYSVGLHFTNTANDCVCKVVIPLKQYNNPTGTLSVHLYSFSGTERPDALLGTATETKTYSDLTTSYADYTFNFSPCVTLEDTQNYLVITSSALNANTVYFASEYNTTGSFRTESYSTLWGSVDTTSAPRMVIYK